MLCYLKMKGRRKKKRSILAKNILQQVLSHCKIKLHSSIYNSPLLSCCLLYMHTMTQKANIHSEVGNEEFHWLVQDSSCFVNQQNQSSLW